MLLAGRSRPSQLSGSCRVVWTVFLCAVRDVPGGPIDHMESNLNNNNDSNCLIGYENNRHGGWLLEKSTLVITFSIRKIVQNISELCSDSITNTNKTWKTYNSLPLPDILKPPKGDCACKTS